MGNWTSEDATREVLAVLPLLNRIVGAEVRREAGEDTTIGQFRVLAHLGEGPLTLSVLAKRRRVSLQSMSELMQVLVERGWISRAPDPSDRRQHLLDLTESGRAHYLRVQDMTIRQLAPLLAQLSADEMAAVRMALPALRRVLMQEENSESNGD
ncbi:MAG: MarR family transcriptional regulator [Roseiflexaceae bacterium]